MSYLFIEQLANTIDARHDPGEYWQGVMKDQPMPEAIQGLIHQGDSVSPVSNKKRDCHTSTDAKEKPFVKDFDPRPNVSAYSDDTKLTGEKSFVKDFEPRPNISAYSDDTKLTEEKSFVKDFEPRPNVSAYSDDAGLKDEKAFVKDFEPRPNISVYQN
ncbi:hypothetical protein Acr_06g0016200 [Actinidia rufa]|uniref:Organ-specific protein S2 n=1 Tax=Actinidia rufa TaxID=165716 RepID=A0A7J0ETL7_9ERIC|nr:hypothetical protein Acr_06g0016200 [Actinidia rufa]